MANGNLDFYCNCKECKGFGLGWVSHIDGTWVRVHRSYINGFLVDTITGEILGIDDVSSIHDELYDYKPSLAVWRSIDDSNEYLNHVDLRRLPKRNKNRLRESESDAYYAWKDSKGAIDCRVTAPMMRVLKALELAIKYRNIVATTQADLAKLLGVTPANLMTKLKPLVGRGLIRIRTSLDGVRKGEVILTVNPNLIFRGDDTAQDRHFELWYEHAATNNPNSATQKNKQPLNAKTTVRDNTDEPRALHLQAETDVVGTPLAA